MKRQKQHAEEFETAQVKRDNLIVMVAGDKCGLQPVSLLSQQQRYDPVRTRQAAIRLHLADFKTPMPKLDSRETQVWRACEVDIANHRPNFFSSHILRGGYTTAAHAKPT
jgi:hypothetical protein